MMTCKSFQKYFYKYLCPCLSDKPDNNTTTDIPKFITDTLADVNVNTSPKSIENETTDDEDYSYGSTNIINSPRKIVFKIDNDYIRKSSDSIELGEDNNKPKIVEI